MIWLAHALTLSRIALAVAFALADGAMCRLVIVGLAALTDALDGFVARRASHRGTIGDWLDPACDKIFVAVCLVAAAPSWWFVALVATRELIMAPLAPFVRFPTKASPIGKVTTNAQLIAICTALVAPRYAIAFAVAASVCGALAALDYVKRRT